MGGLTEQNRNLLAWHMPGKKVAQRRTRVELTRRAVVCAGVLWSATTARDIVALITEDVEAGRLAPAEAMDLTDRVWARAGPQRIVPTI